MRTKSDYRGSDVTNLAYSVLRTGRVVQRGLLLDEGKGYWLEFVDGR